MKHDDRRQNQQRDLSREMIGAQPTQKGLHARVTGVVNIYPSDRTVWISLGFFTSGLDFLTQTADERVDAAFERPRRRAMCQADQLVARQHAVRMFAKRVQKIEFGARHRDLRPDRRHDLTRREVDAPAGEFIDLPRGTRLDRVRRARAPQHRADSRQQFARIERLGEIIVGAHFETDDLVDILALRRDDNDRQISFGPQSAANRQSVLPGKI